MDNNNINIDLAANLDSLSSGSFHQQLLDIFDLLTGYRGKVKDTNSSSSGDTIELDNGVKFTWER